MRESLPHGFRSPHGDALISQLFLLMSAFCRFLRNLQKFAYSTIRSTICLVFSGLRSLPFSSLRSSSGTFSQDPPPFSFVPRERYHRFWCQDILSRSSQTPRQSWMPQSAQRSLLGTTEFQKLHGVHDARRGESYHVNSTRWTRVQSLLSHAHSYGTHSDSGSFCVFPRLCVCVRFAQHTSSPASSPFLSSLPGE